MMRRVATLFLAALGVWALLLPDRARADDPARKDSLTLADFAQGLSLVPREPRAIHSVLLPAQVYRGLVQRDFVDLRVYNRAGVQVPHAVRPLEPAASRVTESAELPIFPLRARPGAIDPRTAVVLQATRDSAGTIVAVQLPEAAPAAKADPNGEASLAPIVAYLVDASTFREPMDALHIALDDQQPGDQVLSVLVESSDDLANFRSVGPPQALVRLRYGTHEIEQNRLDLPELRARFLRLSWGAAPAPPFRAVRVEAARDVVAPPLEKERAVGKWQKAGEEALYDLGGIMPLEALRVVLVEDNTLIRAELAGSTKREGPFEAISEGTFYRVRHAGTLLESEPAPAEGIEARFIRLRTSPLGGGLGPTPPELELQRRPVQLLFAERGPGPFELAFGHYGAVPSAFGPGELLAMLPEAARRELPDSDTALGPVRALAGPRALTAPPPPPPVKKYVLWVVLVAAVALLGVAAWRLARKES